MCVCLTVETDLILAADVLTAPVVRVGNKVVVVVVAMISERGTQGGVA